MSQGWNPVHGHDPSSRPYDNGGMPVPQPHQAYTPHTAPGYYFAAPAAPAVSYIPMAAVAYPALPAYLPGWPQPAAPLQPLPLQPNGQGAATARTPATEDPSIDPSMPAAQMSNTTGGVGCEPGYNYFFAAEHTKIHVLTCSTPPWQLGENSQVPFIAAHVPTGVRIGELMRGFGCNNPTPKQNRVHEVVPAGNGKWYHGLSMGGDDKDMMKKTLADVGWDSDRTGDQKPVVYLWFTKGV